MNPIHFPFFAALTLPVGEQAVDLRTIAPPAVDSPLAADTGGILTYVVRPSRSPPMASSDQWRTVLDLRFERVRSLPEGWDGPKSLPPTSAALGWARALLDVALPKGQPAQSPFIVPLADGGIQVEWHRLGYDLEMTIGADGSVSTWVRHVPTEMEFEEDGDPALDLLFRYARRIAAPLGDDVDVHRQEASARVVFAA